jgi:hypothetical protein
MQSDGSSVNSFAFFGRLATLFGDLLLLESLLLSLGLVALGKHAALFEGLLLSLGSLLLSQQ